MTNQDEQRDEENERGESVRPTKKERGRQTAQEQLQQLKGAEERSISRGNSIGANKRQPRTSCVHEELV